MNGNALRTRGSVALAVVWFGLAAFGVAGTWYFNILSFTDSSIGYLEGWFANPASSSAAVDVIVVALAACVFMVAEGVRLGWARWVWVLVPLSFLIAIAFTLPLFLGLRELSLRARRREEK